MWNNLSNDLHMYTYMYNNFTNALNQIESAFSDVSNYSQLNVNKFWLQYYGVVNLSDIELTYTELQVLGKGFKFCPTPPMYDHGKIKESLDKFFRSASLKLFFEDNNETLENIDPGDLNEPFEHKSMKLPSISTPPSPSYLDFVQNFNN